RMREKALEIDASDERSSSTIMPSPPCSLTAASSAEALPALRVVITTKYPSLANFCVRAPPIPQRMPTGRSLSSIVRPCASLVLRPSDCHLEVAPIMTATGFLFAFICFRPWWCRPLLRAARLRLSAIRTGLASHQSACEIEAAAKTADGYLRGGPVSRSSQGAAVG